MNSESHGKRNLILLGVSAILFTALSTGLSLWIYRSSGDIYLDRSRPGYLPDKEEAEEEASSVNSSFTFSENGKLTQSELETYLKELKTTNERLEALADPYAPGPLSDESLGISPNSTIENEHPDEKNS